VVRLVGLGLGVSLVSEALETAQGAANVCFRRLADPSAAIEYCLASKPDAGSELVQKAATIIRQATLPLRTAKSRRR
jgi:hypothetical protein